MRLPICAVLLTAVALTLSVGCAKGPPPPTTQVLLPLSRPVAWNPTPADRAAARAAAAALSDDRDALDAQIAIVHSTEAFEKGEDLDVLAEDLRNSTVDDARARTASGVIIALNLLLVLLPFVALMALASALAKSARLAVSLVIVGAGLLLGLIHWVGSYLPFVLVSLDYLPGAQLPQLFQG